jgi:hypothetical protein
MYVAYLVPMQKSFQVVETEGTTNRDGLRCITCPKLTIWVATNGSEDWKDVKCCQRKLKLRSAYALRQSASCLEPRQRICFKRREAWTKRAQRKHKQEINPLTFHIILRHTPKDRVCPGSHMTDGEENLMSQSRRIPICGIIFSAVALLPRIYFKKRVDFTALARKRSLCSCAEI